MTRGSLSCVVVACIAGSAFAGDEINLNIYENSSGQAFPGLDIAVELLDQGGSADLVFRNRSSISSVVTDFYIENTSVSSQLGTPAFGAVTGNVLFNMNATPPLPAPGGLGAPWGGNFFSAEADNPQPFNGIGAGESLTLNVPLGGVAYQDLVAALRDPQQLRIVTKVQSLPNGASVWQVTPSPSAAALLALGGLVAARRRR